MSQRTSQSSPYSLLLVLAALTAIGIAGRLLSRDLTLWNFTPVAAIGLFAGFYFERRIVAAAVTIGAMTISNLVIGGYPHIGVMLTVYGALLFPICLRSWLRTDMSSAAVVATSLLSSLVFFLTTNFAHYWYTMEHTGANLTAAFVSALPFFRMTLAGDLFFSGLLFGAYAWATQRSRQLALQS